jgi:hypothetical protein
MTRLYRNAADVTAVAGPPAAEILRLKNTEIMRLTDPYFKRDYLLHQKIGCALNDVPNSKERAGHPDEILLQADNGGDDDVLPSAIDTPSVTVLPSITDASSMTKIRVVNTAVAGMHRRLTEVSNCEVMKTACGSGSSGTVTLSNDFVNKLVVSESNTIFLTNSATGVSYAEGGAHPQGHRDIAKTEETCLDATCDSAMATCLADYACMQLMYSAKACNADPDADVHACYITELLNTGSRVSAASRALLIDVKDCVFSSECDHFNYASTSARAHMLALPRLATVALGDALPAHTRRAVP